MLAASTVFALLAAWPAVSQEVDLVGRPSPAVDYRRTSIEVTEGIVGFSTPPATTRMIMIGWEPDSQRFRAVDRRRGADAAQGRDVSEPEFRELVQQLLELGVLDLSLGEPIGGEDAYRRNTRLEFRHAGRTWRNEAPRGCDRLRLNTWPSLDEERRFQAALDAIEAFVAPQTCTLPVPGDVVTACIFWGPRPAPDSRQRVLWRGPEGYGDEAGLVAASEIEKIKAALLASRDSRFSVEAVHADPRALLEALGVSEAAFVAHQRYLFSRVFGRSQEKARSVDLLPDSVREQLSYDAIQAYLGERLVPYRSGHFSRVTIGFYRHELPLRPVSVELVGSFPVFLPLHVRADGHEWYTADPALLRRLSVLMPSSRERTAMERIAELGRDVLWQEDLLWHPWVRRVREAIEDCGPELLPADAFGPDLCVVGWDVEQHEQGFRVRSVEAVPTKQKTWIRRVTFSCPKDRNFVATQFRRANEVVSSQSRIAKWLGAGPSRHVEVCIDRPAVGPPAWAGAGLLGRPALTLTFLEQPLGTDAAVQRGQAWAGESTDEVVIVGLP